MCPIECPSFGRSQRLLILVSFWTWWMAARRLGSQSKDLNTATIPNPEKRSWSILREYEDLEKQLCWKVNYKPFSAQSRSLTKWKGTEDVSVLSSFLHPFSVFSGTCSPKQVILLTSYSSIRHFHLPMACGKLPGYCPPYPRFPTHYLIEATNHPPRQVKLPFPCDSDLKESCGVTPVGWQSEF